MDGKIIQKAGVYFTEEEKHRIIQELISTQCTKVEIWEKYTGEPEEHGQLLRWMRALGYQTADKSRRPNISSTLHSMPRKKLKPDKGGIAEEESFETLQLKKRIAELEKQLKEAELKAIAFSTMVDIAEKEFKIPIRKKLNTKP
jgi:transposase